MYVQIGTTKYPPADIAIRRKALDQLGDGLGEGGHAASLAFLFGVPGSAWTFPNENAFLRALNIFEAAPIEQRTPQTLPNMLTVARRPASVPLPGGTVTLIGTRYASAAALALAPAVTGLLALAATIRHAGLLALASDPLNGYAFPTWAAATTALGTWNGQGAVPPAALAFRVPVRPPSVLVRYDPSSVVTGAQDIVDHERRYTYAWGTCGMTGEHMTGRLLDLGGDIQREAETTYGQGQGAALRQLLLTPVTVRTVYEIFNPMLHHFIVEKRPSDQGAVLQQGYIGAYTAPWWAGLTTEGMSLRKPDDQEALAAMRTYWGGGRTVDLGTLGTRLGAFLAEPRISTVGSTTAWRQLPFLPSAELPPMNEPAAWVVRTWSVADPQTVFDTVETRLNGGYPQEWVTHTVMREAAEYQARIAVVRASLRT
ncbi:hypothetical protein ACIBEA_23500 [Streptomyces sp. NPDC051555]|uniref:hypothetical protein n=1 Tax=Streptomyces sp. NPDC051555 TaxID=3365657 RepID=UPI0037A555B1